MTAQVISNHATDAVPPKENKGWLMEKAKVMTRIKREVPTTCGPYEVIVCPKRTGICGSDMHIFQSGEMSGVPMKHTLTLGHECAGIVAKVGSLVRGLKEGDRVALEPGQGCKRCYECKSGAYAQCEFMEFAAAGETHGTLQGYYTLPADLVYKLPDNMSLEEGATMEPLAVAVQAVNFVAEMRPAKNVAVFGAGPIGLMTMAAAKALGAKRIIAIDVQQERLDFAAKYAATDVHLASPPNPGESRTDYSKRHADILKEKYGLSERGPAGIDYIFECTGAEVCVQTALWLLKRRGVYVQVGNPHTINLAVPWLIIGERELNIKGTYRYGPGVYELAIDLVSRGLIDVKPMITHKYTFDQCLEAFETSRVGKGPDGAMAIKVQIEGPLD